MKLRNARDNYYFHTGKASDLIRYLGFAGLALIWIFTIELNPEHRVPADLVPAAIFIVAGLGLDLLHYVVASGAWGIYQWAKEKQLTKIYGVSKKEEVMFDYPNPINYPSLGFYVLKLAAIIVAYVFILRFLFNRLL